MSAAGRRANTAPPVLADGRLASGDIDGTIKLWLVENEKLIAALCLRAGRNLTKAEWAHYVGSDTPWQPSCRDRRPSPGRAGVGEMRRKQSIGAKQQICRVLTRLDPDHKTVADFRKDNGPAIRQV